MNTSESQSVASTPPIEQVHAPSFESDAYFQGVKLMIVDGNVTNVEAIRRYLGLVGCFNVIAAGEAEQALTLIAQEQPDLVLLDIIMPEVDSLAILRQIRREPAWVNLPVVILTACNDPAVRRNAFEAGATDFLSTPVDPHELSLRLRNVLEIKAFRDHVAQREDQLESEIERQAHELAAAQHDAELRYLAGKAEIATDVLHNVGNALQSVNTGVNLVSYTVRESKLLSLKRATGLLAQHESNLAKFLTKDPRGKILPSYLIELTEALLSERQKVTSELELVSKHLEHINAVVATQQKYASLCNVTDEVHLADLMADVEELVGNSFARHGIEVVRQYEPVPPVMTDRQKLLQVLLNLVKNAIDAMKPPQAERAARLSIGFGIAENGNCFLEIADNGQGIEPTNLVKIFAHGYTTKSDGHGFGLHSCANIMKELGGSIRVHSAGKGHGAKFVLELPLNTN